MYNIFFLLAMYTFSGNRETDIYIEMFLIVATKRFRMSLPRIAVALSGNPPGDRLGKINNSTDPFDCLCVLPCFPCCSLCPRPPKLEIVYGSALTLTFELL